MKLRVARKVWRKWSTSGVGRQASLIRAASRIRKSQAFKRALAEISEVFACND